MSRGLFDVLASERRTELVHALRREGWRVIVTRPWRFLPLAYVPGTWLELGDIVLAPPSARRT